MGNIRNAVRVPVATDENATLIWRKGIEKIINRLYKLLPVKLLLGIVTTGYTV
jgi:hypothetical protein